MSISRDRFHLKPVPGDGTTDPYYEVRAVSISPQGTACARKKSNGYWDLWFEMPTINDSPIVPRLRGREACVREASELFVQIVPFPSCNRYIIRDVKDTAESTDAALLLLFALLTLLQSPTPPTLSSERIEEQNARRKLALQGTLYSADRPPTEQARVVRAFQTLTALGYRAFETSPRSFVIHRALLDGGYTLAGKCESIEQLEKEIERREKKRSGWRTWLS